MDIDGNNILQIKAIGVAISTFETPPESGRVRDLLQRLVGTPQPGACRGMARAAGTATTSLLNGQLEAVSLQRTIARFIYGEVRS